MQRCERAMYEAGERVKLGRLTGDEVTFAVGSKSMHRPLTAQAASTKPDEDTDNLWVCRMESPLRQTKRWTGLGQRFQNWAATM